MHDAIDFGRRVVVSQSDAQHPLLLVEPQMACNLVSVVVAGPDEDALGGQGLGQGGGSMMRMGDGYRGNPLIEPVGARDALDSYAGNPSQLVDEPLRQRLLVGRGGPISARDLLAARPRRAGHLA